MNYNEKFWPALTFGCVLFWVLMGFLTFIFLM